MGIDFFINLTLMIDPFVLRYGPNGFHKDKFDGKDFIVPEEYRQFLSMRGPHLKAYLDLERNYAEIDVLLTQFPTWEKVKNEIEDFEDEYWNEGDHNLFHKALQWFSNEPRTGSFISRWSY